MVRGSIRGEGGFGSAPAARVRHRRACVQGEERRTTRSG
jgi:hypothetical protein